MKEDNKLLKSAADYDYLKASSVQDCTGLIPSGIIHEHELESYQDIYPFLPHPTESSNQKGSLD